MHTKNCKRNETNYACGDNKKNNYYIPTSYLVQLIINVTECTAPTDQSVLIYNKKNQLHIFVLQCHLVWYGLADDRTKVE